MSLVRSASTQLISAQSQLWRSTGIRIKSGDLRKPGFSPPPLDHYTLQAGLSVYQTIQQQINVLEQSAYQAVKLSDAYTFLQTVTGIGKILGGRQDKQFGPVILVGLGGIFVEIFEQATLRIAPISRKEAFNV